MIEGPLNKRKTLALMLTPGFVAGWVSVGAVIRHPACPSNAREIRPFPS